MLISVCSVKGAPGVTTTALALAARWPMAEPIVVEGDPSGGDLAVRFGLPNSPGIVSLAAAARREADPTMLAEHTQKLPGGVHVVVGAIGSDQARAALGVLGKQSMQMLKPSDADGSGFTALVDVGRLDHTSPALPVVRAADALLVLARPRADELAHVSTLLNAIPTWTRTPGLVLVGSGYSPAEVERELRVPVLATLPDDRRGAKALTGLSSGRGPHRSALGRAARRLADRIVEHVASAEGVTPAEQSKTWGTRVVEPEHAASNGNGVDPR